MSGSSSKGSSKPVDMTPQAFKNLQSPFATALSNLLGGVMNTGAAPASTGPTAGGQPFQGGSATRTPYDQKRLDYFTQGSGHGRTENVGNKPAQTPAPVAGANPAAPVPSGQPYDPNNALSGIPGYQGPLTAELGENERILLDQLMQMSGAGGGGGTTSPAQQALMDIISGTGTGGYKPTGSLADYAQMLQGAAQTEGYSPDGNNPFVQAAIEAAQRPTFQALEETLSRTLPGRFTQAGQFINPQGSSAFDRAAAMAARDAQQTAADIGTNISFGSFEAERGRQFEGQEAARAREAAALEAEQARRAGASESAADRSLDAAKSLPGVTKQEMDTTIANLQAQALPRLIQEMGIERGLEEFQNRMNSLLTTLGIAGAATQPTIGNSSTQKSSSFGLPMGSK